MKTTKKMIRFERTVTVEGATYKAGAVVDPERIPPSYLACCLRVGHCSEIDEAVVDEPESEQLSESSEPAGDQSAGSDVPKSEAPAAPAKKTKKRK